MVLCCDNKELLLLIKKEDIIYLEASANNVIATGRH